MALGGCSRQDGQVATAPKASPFDTAHIGPKDRIAIEALIKTETKEKITLVHKLGTNTIEVFTGRIRGPLSGGGDLYGIERVGTNWVIRTRGGWAA